MSNFSYAAKVLKAEFCAFLDPLAKGLRRPVAKLLFDLVFGVVASGSAKLSDVARHIGDESLDSAEHRLSRAIAKNDPKPVADALSKAALSLCPEFLCCDESDVQKPYGKAFEGLDAVQDGSADGRPIGKGYHVVCVAGIAGRNSPMPLCLWAYSGRSEGFESQLREHEKLFPKKAPGKAIAMDRGYDSKAFMSLCRERGIDFVIRAKSMRKYQAPSAKSKARRDCFQTADSIKGRYAFFFREPGKPGAVEVKASAVWVTHEDIGGAWLLVERFPDEREPRCYLTSIDCSTRAGCERALKAYRLRWRIEECFRFMKGCLDMEGFRVRSLNAANWVLLAVCAATALLSFIASSRSPAYWQCRNVFRSFEPEMSDEAIVKSNGHISIELYRLARGAARILSHCKKPTPKGRDRRRRQPIQLLLDDELFG